MLLLAAKLIYVTLLYMLNAAVMLIFLIIRNLYRMIGNFETFDFVVLIQSKCIQMFVFFSEKSYSHLI